MFLNIDIILWVACLGRMILALSPSLRSWACGCCGPHDSTLVSCLSLTCPTQSPCALWVLWAARFYTCLLLVSHSLPLVSLWVPWPHGFAFVPCLSPIHFPLHCESLGAFFCICLPLFPRQYFWSPSFLPVRCFGLHLTHPFRQRCLSAAGETGQILGMEEFPL